MNNYKVLDLHGENSDIAKILVNEFINDAIKLGISEITIIHGKGKGILKKAVHELLRNDKRVLEYKINFLNNGETIVKIRQELTK